MAKTIVINKDSRKNWTKDEVFCRFYHCPSCGDWEIRDKFNYCPICGAKIQWASDEDEKGGNPCMEFIIP